MLLFFPSLLLASLAAAAPSVQLSYVTVIGSNDNDIDTFNGIPFAQPPLNQLRLKPPQPITSNLGNLTLPSHATSCPQFIFEASNLPNDIVGYLLDTPLFEKILNTGEDCLTINVQRPVGVTKGANLPVVFWIFGGGFEIGGTIMYGGRYILQHAVKQQQPIVYVEVSYRLGGFGFMGGKELTEEGSTNLGLLDQRMAMQWVADNIAEFGGDPEKVTIWGESAGAISVFDQMCLYDGNNTYKGKPLFRGAIMNSGSQIPARRTDGVRAQETYDAVVEKAGCKGENNTLECLRALDYETFLNAANSVPPILGYTTLALSYLPRPDGITLTDSPEALAAAGKFTDVPFIIGDQEDEGTLFALFTTNLTTTEDLVDYFSTVFFPLAPRDMIANYVALYPEDPSAGSPFRTGIWNELIYPQYKRIAAMLGDIVFTLLRRLMLSHSLAVHPTTPSWSYLSSYYHNIIPFLGTFHGSDLFSDFGVFPVAANSIMNYYLAFIYSLDPNANSAVTGEIEWPQWKENQTLMNFGFWNNKLISDDFRAEAADFILKNYHDFQF